MVSEANIRDFLAENLSFIESGLTFRKKEFSLNNDLGAGGRVDILARDQFGIFVIIEIKKSGKTARQALHELQKYIALFRTNHGLAADKCRCILISTDWHELLVPFSEFSRAVDYQIDGYKLILDESGIPTSKEAIQLAPEGEERFLFHLHNVLLFCESQRRDFASGLLREILSELGVEEYYSFTMDYEGSSENVMFPFAQCLVLYRLNREEEKEIKKTLNALQNDEEEELHNEESSEEELSSRPALEEEILCEVNRRFLGLCDDVEVGVPTSLAAALSSRWAVGSIYRNTRSSSRLPITDEEILKELTSFDAGNSSVFELVTTPRIEAAWEAACKKLKCFLQHNDFWDIGSELFLKKIGSMSKTATVSIRIYDHCGILFWLYNLYCRRVSYLPTLEIVAQVPEENRVFTLRGFLEWDEETFPNIESILQGEDFFQFHTREKLFYKEEPVHNLVAMYKHGISYSLHEIEIEKDKRNIKKFSWNDDEDNIVVLPTDGSEALSLFKFLKENCEYLNSLCYLGNSYFAFLG